MRQRPPTPCLHKTASKSRVEESWTRGQRYIHPTLQLATLPPPQRPAGQGLRGDSAPLCWVLALRTKLERGRGHASPPTRARDTASLFLPPFHFPSFHPGHLYLKGWDYGRTRMTSLSLPAAEKKKAEFPSAVSVRGLVGSSRITTGRKREWSRGGAGGSKGALRCPLRAPPSRHAAPLWTPQTVMAPGCPSPGLGPRNASTGLLLAKARRPP